MGSDPDKLAEIQSEICSVFSNPRRILILWVLLDQELSVGEIATAINASLQNTSHHLRLMKDKGILSSKRDGKSVSYRIINHDLVEHLLRIAPNKLKNISVPYKRSS